MNANFQRLFSTMWIAGLFSIGFLSGCQSPQAVQATPERRTYSFWPQSPDEPRIQFLASFTSSEDVAPVQTSRLERIVFGKNSAQTAMIVKPYGVASRDGKIYVADMRGKALVVLDLKKKETRLVGVTGVNRLDHPVAVAVADDGMIYVADNARGSVFVYDAAERHSQIFGFPKFVPVALAVHGDRIYAADRAGQNIVIFNRKSGKKLSTFGTVGDENSQFRVPLGVATDRNGNVYVMDMMQCRMQKFTRDGEFISAMGSLGDYMGSFARPKHISVDNDGLIYIIDATFDNVQMFDPEYRMLMHFGAMGDFPGAMNLPAGIAVSDEGLDVFRDRLHPGFDAKRLVVVTNQFGPTKVVVYALGQRRPEYSLQDLTADAAVLPTGTGKPTDEQLKIQNPGGEEPPDDKVKPEAPPAETPAPATPPKPAAPPQPR